jgi:hypothetical protein
MFKLIGGVVVCGFALYGLSKYLKRPVVNLVIQPDSFSGAGKPGVAEAAADATAMPGEAARDAAEVDSTAAAA